MQIFKYPLPALQTSPIAMPTGAKVLTVQMQNCFVTLWALVDPKAPAELRTFDIIGTGWPIDGDPGNYVGTVQAQGFVWHVFEKPKPERRPVGPKV